MKLEENKLGIYELTDDLNNFVSMDLSDLIDTYNQIQEKLKERGVLF